MTKTNKNPLKKTSEVKKSSLSAKEKKTTISKEATSTKKTVSTKKATNSATQASKKKIATANKKLDNKSSLDPKIQEFFQDYHQEDGRIFLTQPRSYGELPDLLELQKKGYHDFISLYLPKLFEDVENIWDIAGEKMYVAISDIKVGEPMDSYEICKKKELTYGGIITAKVKLVERIEDEKTHKISEKLHFQKKANV